MTNVSTLSSDQMHSVTSVSSIHAEKRSQSTPQIQVKRVGRHGCRKFRKRLDFGAVNITHTFKVSDRIPRAVVIRVSTTSCWQFTTTKSSSVMVVVVVDGASLYSHSCHLFASHFKTITLYTVPTSRTSVISLLACLLGNVRPHMGGSILRACSRFRPLYGKAPESR